MYCPPSPVPPCHPNRRPGPSPPAYPQATVTTSRSLHGNTPQTYSAARPNPYEVILEGISVEFDGSLTLTGADGAFDDLEGATQMLIDGLGELDGWRSITVDVANNTITIAAYHSCGETIYATDELGNLLTDETGALYTLSNGCVAPGTYVVDITATVGRTYSGSCSHTIPADTYFRECQEDADAYALAKATELAQACIAEDTALLYRNSEMIHTAYCPAGSTGSNTATVAYNTFTSEISQRDADNKARTAAIAEAVGGLTCGCGFSDVVWTATTATGNVTVDIDGGSFSATLEAPALDSSTALVVEMDKLTVTSAFAGTLRATVTRLDLPSLPDTEGPFLTWGIARVGSETVPIDSFPTNAVGVQEQTINFSEGDEFKIVLSAIPNPSLAGSTSLRFSVTVELLCP